MGAGHLCRVLVPCSPSFFDIPLFRETFRSFMSNFELDEGFLQSGSEPLVGLRYFGPDTRSDLPTAGS